MNEYEILTCEDCTLVSSSLYDLVIFFEKYINILFIKNKKSCE